MLSHISKPLSDKGALIYVVRILKDIDHSTLSNNLLNFSPKTRQPEPLYRKRMKSKRWSGYEESHISQPFADKGPLIYVVRILKVTIVIFLCL